MGLIAKMQSYLTDPDCKRFFQYAVGHPNAWKRRQQTAVLPEYLTSADLAPKKVDPHTTVLHRLRAGDGGNGARGSDDQLWTSHLAGMDTEIDTAHMDWTRTFSDTEDIAAFHRFLWLYRAVWESAGKRKELQKTAVNMILSWIAEVGEREKDSVHFEIWQTYTVAERVSNWLLVLSLTTPDEEELDERILTSVLEQLEYIKAHFEYFGEKFTGNHFSNDGRALYLCGALLGIDSYRELGQKILLHEYQRVIVDSGFLREGSSHYQFLYTKWFCDIYWTACSCGDDAFAEVVRPMLERLTLGCRFFLVKGKKWQIPLIGDISPDLQPEWLFGVPWAAEYMLRGAAFEDIPETPGYHSYFVGTETKRIGRADKPEQDIVSRDFGKASAGDFALFTHVNHSLYPNNLTGHFHHDTGSFVLFCAGEPLLIDCGRTNYELTGAGARGRNYTGHNICSVDGNNPEINMRTFFTENFLSAYVGNVPEMRCQPGRIDMDIPGYARFRNVKSAKRTIAVSEDNVTVSDRFEATGKHEYTVFLHIPDIWKVDTAGSGLRVKGEKAGLEITFSVAPDRLDCVTFGKIFGHCAEEYGDDRACTTVVFQKQSVDDFHLETVIRLLKE